MAPEDMGRPSTTSRALGEALSLSGMSLDRANWISMKLEEAPESIRAKVGTVAPLMLILIGMMMFSSFFGLLVDRELATGKEKAEIPG